MNAVRSICLATCCIAFAPLAWGEDNAKLREIYEADQADRQAGTGKIDWLAVSRRDAEREATVLGLVREGRLTTSPDYFHAAMVFQHGGSADDTALAYSLATIATRIEPTHPQAAWLTAAAWDRLLMRKRKPQWYGTQFTKGTSGKWELYEVDERAVSDEERKRLGVPPLEASRDRARTMNEE